MKRIFAVALSVFFATPAFAADPASGCPQACSVTLPAEEWDRIGAALVGVIRANQALIGDLSRQVQAQIPKEPAPTPSTLSQEEKSNTPPARQ